MRQQQTFDRLFDYVIRGGEQPRWNIETGRLDRLHVDDQRVLDRRLDGKVAGLGAFEDAIDLGSRRAHLSKASIIRAADHQHGNFGILMLVSARAVFDGIVH